MPKTVDYPRGSLRMSLFIADAVYDLGGSCSVQMAADKLGKKMSGAFDAAISAAVKYGLIVKKRGQLSVADTYREYKLAYTPEEASAILQQAFLSAALFRRIYERFKTGKLPIDIFGKLLMKEFGVPSNVASRVVKYFVDGARSTGLLNGDNSFNLMSDGSSGITEPHKESKSPLQPQDGPLALSIPNDASGDSYSITFLGPGMNSTFAIRESDDLDIVEAVLKKVRKSIEKTPDEAKE